MPKQPSFVLACRTRFGSGIILLLVQALACRSLVAAALLNRGFTTYARHLSNQMAKAKATTTSLAEFLSDRRMNPTHSLVLGNEAGDADSIISSIVLAYVETVFQNATATPIVSIARDDLKTKRPETTLLLELAGISQDSLLFIDSPIVTDENRVANLTLVDHNHMCEAFRHRATWTVVEIMDHHHDHGLYQDSVEQREIAFADGQAAVASACTLVAERMLKYAPMPYAADVSLLLLGVILLDSVNMSEAAGKGTKRDAIMIQTIMDGARWSDLPSKSQSLLQITSASTTPSLNALFEAISAAKHNPKFWEKLSVRDSLRLDYKGFQGGGVSFGLSTVLLARQDFVGKHNLIDETIAFMNEVVVDLLGILHTHSDEKGHLHRQLTLCAKPAIPLDSLTNYLLHDETLDLKEMKDATTSTKGIVTRCFVQRNSQASRKQVGPIMVQFFESDYTRTQI